MEQRRWGGGCKVGGGGRKMEKVGWGVRQRMEREDKGEKKGERAEREGKVGGRMEGR